MRELTVFTQTSRGPTRLLRWLPGESETDCQPQLTAILLLGQRLAGSTRVLNLFTLTIGLQPKASRIPWSLEPFMGSFISPSPNWICFLFLLSFFCISATHASPLDLASHVSSAIIRSDGNTTEVTGPHGPATDAGGTGLNPPTVIWLCFSLAVGIFTSLAGTLMSLKDRFIGGISVKLGFYAENALRGFGVGLAAATVRKFSQTKYPWNPPKTKKFTYHSVAVILLNAIPSQAHDKDLIISIVVIGLFLCGSIFCAIQESRRYIGDWLIGIMGGLAVGTRLMMLMSSRPGLLPLIYGVIGICGFAGAGGVWMGYRGGKTLVCCPIVLRNVFVSVY